jgi:hypothetical protein
MYSIQLGETTVFLIAVSYHSKVVTGRPDWAPGLVPNPFGTNA